MKKIFLDELPHNWKGVDWQNCVGRKVHFIYDDIEGDFEIVNYIKGKNYYNKLETNYNGRIARISIATIASAGLGNIIGKFSSEYRYNVGDNFKDKNRNITLTKRETRKQVMPKRTDIVRGYKYHCNICGWDDGWLPETMITRGIGCSCCSGTTIVEGINDIPTTDPWMVDFFPGGYNEAKKYARHSMKKVLFKCPYCNKKSKKERIISNLYKTKSIPCSCSDKMSFMEKYMHNLLLQLTKDGQILDYSYQKKFDWCKFYNTFQNKDTFGIYDFVIEEIKLIIETDGGFHRSNNKMSGQSKGEAEFRDLQKDILAHKNGYKVIRITDIGNFKDNILHSELSEIFNLDSINWNECLKQTCNNLAKEVCVYKNNNPKSTITSISKVFHVNPNLISKWIKIGDKLGWCKYNKRITKEVVCLETMMVYGSAKECVEAMLQKGDYITMHNIRNSLRKHGEIACFGLHYKYYDELADEEKLLCIEWNVA